MHPEDLPRAEQDCGVRSRKEGVSEYRAFWPDGSVRWIQARGKVFFDEAGEPSRWVGINIDVTERKLMDESRRQAEALREADRRKNEFLAILAHELRNPLAISNAIQILTLRGDDPALVAQTKEVMERQVHQMTRMVDELLEVSRIGRGKISLQTAASGPGRGRRHRRRNQPPARRGQAPHVDGFSARASGARRGRRARLAQVLSNLLNNAAKYTEEGGRIDLIVEQAQAEVVIRVRDNGIGMAQAIDQRLRHVRADRRRGRSLTGRPGNRPDIGAEPSRIARRQDRGSQRWAGEG